MQRPACLAGAPLGVHRVRDRQRVGIELEDGAQRWAFAIERGDAIEIGLRDAMRRQASCFHAVLELGDGHFLESEVTTFRGEVLGEQCPCDGEGGELGEFAARERIHRWS